MLTLIIVIIAKMRHTQVLARGTALNSHAAPTTSTVKPASHQPLFCMFNFVSRFLGAFSSFPKYISKRLGGLAWLLDLGVAAFDKVRAVLLSVTALPPPPGLP